MILALDDLLVDDVGDVEPGLRADAGGVLSIFTSSAGRVTALAVGVDAR